MGLRNVVGPLVSTKERREVLIALTAAYMLVQLASLPVALSLPTIAEYFDTGVDDAAWIVISYLLALGSMVMLGARLGDRYGHSRVFFVGLIATTVGAILISMANSLFMVVVWRALTGFGAAFVLGNFNAILVASFPQDQRGRAFAIPIMGSRVATMGGLVLFGIFLEFFSWRLMFLSFLPLGIIAVIAAIPLLRQKEHSRPTTTAPVDIIGGILMVAVAFVLILSSNHLHGGEESFTSSKGLSYHIPMQILFLVLVVVFILVERYIKHPLVEMRHFREKYFSLALTSNFAFHFSMLATTTLIPILVENGYGMSPLWVPVILLPNQLLGFAVPLFAGWVYDKYRPKYLRPAAMAAIALGFLMLGLSVGYAPFFALPFLMLPISIGSSVFNPINNATVMSALPLEHRGVASGMLETTRELGHAIGATVSATTLAIVLPAGISALSGSEAQAFYISGFRFSSLMVVFTLLAGASIAYFHKEIAETAKTITSGSSGSSQAQPSLQSESADGDD